MTVGELLDSGREKLAGSGVENARQEVEWMLREILCADSAGLFLRNGDTVTRGDRNRFEDTVRRRVRGEPLQYILGHTEFFGLRIEVGPGVLVPRPETECLVELALRLALPTGGVCDLCTGSGAIVLALASRLPGQRRFIGTDISSGALAYAERNRDRLGLAGVSLLLGDLLAPVPPGTRFGLITANPPYVSSTMYAELPADVRDHEPSGALLADNGGLGLIERVASETGERLLPGGHVLCEIGEDQGQRAADAFRGAGFGHVTIEKDHNGKDRIAHAY